MAQEKIIIEFDRNEAIAVAEALAGSGDEIPERCGLTIRNAVANAPRAQVFYWSDDNDNEYRLYQEVETPPVVQIRNTDGEFDTCVDLADLNYDKIESVILVQLVDLLLGGEESSDDAA